MVSVKNAMSQVKATTTKPAGHPRVSSQVPGTSSSQVQKFPSSEAPKFPELQVPKFPELQVPKFLVFKIKVKITRTLSYFQK